MKNLATAILNVMKEDEVWKDVKGCDGYVVSNKGRIKSTYRKVNSRFGLHRTVKERVLKPALTSNGYLQVWIGKSTSIHRMVAEAFVDNPLQLPYVNHKDGNKQNNEASNLEWCTPKENIHHAIKHGIFTKIKGEQVGASKLKEQDVLDIFFDHRSHTMIAKDYSVSRSAVILIKQKKNWNYLTKNL
jgi:hypothetical protein